MASGIIGQHKPGESWHESLLISDLYDMSMRDEYTIQLEKKWPVELGKGTVKSNIITITAVAPKPEVATPK